MRKYKEGIVECNLLKPYPLACRIRRAKSKACKYCVYNKLNYDEGGFFPSFLEAIEYNPHTKEFVKVSTIKVE